MKSMSLPMPVLQEKVAALTSAQKALVFIITIVLLGGSFYYFIYSDQANQIAGLKGKIAEQEKRLATLKQAAERVTVLQKDLAQAQEEFNQLLTFLPDQKEIPALLDSVSQLGAEKGLENILFQPQPEQKQEFYAAVPIRLDLLGTYHEMGAFLDSLSKMHRILRVESLSMTRQKTGDRLQVGCTLMTYRFIEPKTPEPAGAPAKK